MMEVKKEIAKLEASDIFRKWKKTKDAYLVHIFLGNDSTAAQVGYYCKEDDMLSTFVIDGENIKQLSDSEALKEKEHIIKKLDLNKVKVEFAEAKKKAENVLKEKFPKEDVFKWIFILQNLDTELWNITGIAKNFNTVNIKIDAINGKLLSTDCFSLKDSINLK